MAKHITITDESHYRLKVFSAKYNLPMKKVVDWFILTLIDENGEPAIPSLEEALKELKPDIFKDKSTDK